MCKQIQLAAIDRNKKVTWAKLRNCILQGPVGNHILFKYLTVLATFMLIVVIMFAILLHDRGTFEQR